MIVVLDTNVLLSAAYRDREPERLVRFVAANADIEWVVTAEIVAEYTEVLAREKFGIPHSLQREWLALVIESTRMVSAARGMKLERDPKDAIFLECAVAARADFLVSSDRDLLETRLPRTAIVTPADFMRYVGGSSAPQAGKPKRGN